MPGDLEFNGSVVSVRPLLYSWYGLVDRVEWLGLRGNVMEEEEELNGLGWSQHWGRRYCKGCDGMVGGQGDYEHSLQTTTTTTTMRVSIGLILSGDQIRSEFFLMLNLRPPGAQFYWLL